MMLSPDEARELAREIARTADDEVIHRFQKLSAFLAAKDTDIFK